MTEGVITFEMVLIHWAARRGPLRLIAAGLPMALWALALRRTFRQTPQGGDTIPGSMEG